MNRYQLACAAERRIWSLLIDADEQVRGLDRSDVLDGARARVAWLDAHLPGLTVNDQDDALEAAPESDRDRAFGEAALNMHSTMSMIKAQMEAAW